MSQASQAALHRVKERIKELSIFEQSTVHNVAQVLEEFVRSHGSLGHVALNLTTARMADEVLPK